jgi:hypothetical protein
MSIGGVVLGLINVGIVAAILILLGAAIVWVLGLLSFPAPWSIQRIYLAIVALIALYMVAALLFGIPSLHVIGGY